MQLRNFTIHQNQVVLVRDSELRHVELLRYNGDLATQ